MIDWISVKLYVLTIFCGIFSVATKSEILFVITALAGISTILYNGIRIYPSFIKFYEKFFRKHQQNRTKKHP